MSTPKTLAEWLAHAERLHPENIALGLERVREVASRMGLAFACPVFTVAGTNGKGSTCAMLEAVLTHAGYRVGVYTSPHASATSWAVGSAWSTRSRDLCHI